MFRGEGATIARTNWNGARCAAVFYLGIVFVEDAQAAIRGKVTAPSGAPIASAELTWEGGATPARTDGYGIFRLPEGAAPERLIVRHPLFLETSVAVGDAGGPLTIVLEPAPIFEESVLVLDRRLELDAVPPGTSASTAVPGERPAPPSTVLDVIGAVPGVAENGQGGIFQNYSVRGLSRQRVVSLIAGMRLVGDRRAGVSASFIDPLLLDSVSVVRGPSTIAYGSGAIGGVIEVNPRVHDGADAAAGYATQGDQVHAYGAWGNDVWSAAAAARSQGDSEDPEGRTINDGFRQASATLRAGWTRGTVSYDVLAIPAVGRDIDKATTDYPARTVTYPEENHLLLRFAAASTTGWRVRAFVHPNDLVTLSVRNGTVTSIVENDAFDGGASASWELAPARGPVYRVGADWFGRYGVDATETGPTPGRTLDGAREDEPSLWGTLEWAWHRLQVHGGARVTYNRQSNSGAAIDDAGWDAFGGLVASLPRGVSLTAQVASGSRFPTLSERFFSGTTGRGTAIGNPNLDMETALSTEVAVRWSGRIASTSLSVFRTRIADFIDRVEVEPDVFTYANTRSGTIGGVELEAFVRASEEVRLTASAAAMQGEVDTGDPLEDIPANRVTTGIEWSRSWLGLAAEYQWRASKDDPGVGEKAIPSASLLAASATFRLPKGVRIAVSGANLLDDAYFSSADEKVPLSPGRSYRIGFAWSWAR